VKLAHWNVRSLNEDLLREVPSIMKSRGLDIMTVVETRQKLDGVRQIGRSLNLYHSAADHNSVGGVGIIVNSTSVAKVEFEPLSNRLAIAWVYWKERQVKIVIAYGPTEESLKADAQKQVDFYAALDKAICLQKNNHHWPMVLCGDLNARLGKDAHEICPNIVGNFTLEEETNSNGEQVLDTCIKYNLRIENSYHKKPVTKLATWRHPRTGRLTTLDWVITSGREVVVHNVRSSWQDAIHSDHAMLIALVRIKKNKQSSEPRNAKPRQRKTDHLRHKITRLIKDEKGLAGYRRDIATKIENMDTHAELVKNIETAVNKNAPSRKKAVQRSWYETLTENELVLLKSRKAEYKKLLQDRTVDQLRKVQELNKKAREIISAAKNSAVEKELSQFEALKDQGQMREAFQKLKTTLRDSTTRWFERTKQSHPISEKEFLKHYSELFKKRSIEGEREETILPVTTLNPPDEDEVQKALKQQKSNRAPGANGITSDLLKVSGLTKSLVNIFKSTGKTLH